MCLVVFLFSVVLFAGSAQAQCRQGSGPDQSDGIPWCSPPSAPRQTSEPPRPQTPAQWVDFAAAVAWADSDKGSRFVGGEKQIDEQIARAAVLQKCKAAGWENCTIATSVVNGVIAIGRDNNHALRTKIAATPDEAEVGLLSKCIEAGVTCKIMAVFDGAAEYF
jgi:Domain of unknown function (DUF4189)